MSAAERYAVVVFGLGGFHAHRESCTLSGYDGPDELREPERFEGAAVVDLRGLAERDPFAVLRLPLIRTELEDGTRQSFTELARQASAGFVEAVARAHPTNAAIFALGMTPPRDPGEPGPLDSVSVAEYVRTARRMGARVGRYVAGRCEWE